MATITDINVNPNLSPRVARVGEGVNEVVMQDYVDTLRLLEDDFELMSFPLLIEATGKQDLGGGLLVAITVAEQNLQLSFDPNLTSASSGTVTSGSGAPSVINRQALHDSAGDFINEGVNPGSLIVNFTDQSVTDVVRVISATELECEALEDGTDNLFEIGDVYKIWTVQQKNTAGGNLVAVDEVGASIPAIRPSAFTQVVQATSSSATIQELTEIRYAAYQNAAWVDETTLNTGTDYPTGTPLQPVNNVNDAVLIADALGFRRVEIIGNYTFTAGDVIANKKIVGQDFDHSLFTLGADAVLDGSQFTNASITGTLDAGCTLADCELRPPVNFIQGTIKRCLIEAGTISLSGSTDVHILDSWSGVSGLATPIIDYNGSGRSLIMRNWSGGIEIQNKTGADPVSIDLLSGQIVLDSTVTAGIFRVAGVGRLIDNSSGTTVNKDGLINNQSIAEAVWNALVSAYTVAGSFGQLVGRKLLTVSKFFALK